MKCAREMQTGAQGDATGHLSRAPLEGVTSREEKKSVRWCTAGGDSEEGWETAGCISCENSRVLLYYPAVLLRKQAAGKVKSIFTSIWL